MVCNLVCVLKVCVYDPEAKEKQIRYDLRNYDVEKVCICVYSRVYGM
jgi:hypothetical protein